MKEATIRMVWSKQIVIGLVRWGGGGIKNRYQNRAIVMFSVVESNERQLSVLKLGLRYEHIPFQESCITVFAQAFKYESLLC